MNTLFGPSTSPSSLAPSSSSASSSGTSSTEKQGVSADSSPHTSRGQEEDATADVNPSDDGEGQKSVQQDIGLLIPLTNDPEDIEKVKESEQGLQQQQERQDRAEYEALLSKVQLLEDKIANIEEGGSRRTRKRGLIDLSERGASREERFDDDGIIGLSAHSYGDPEDEYSSVSIPQASPRTLWKPEEDTYTTMMFSPTCLSLGWLLGFFVFAVQLVLAHIILFDQLNRSNSIRSVIFDVPHSVSDLVYAGQFFALFVAMLFSRDIFIAIATFDRFWFYNIEENNPASSYVCHVFLPNIFRLAQGLLVLFVSFLTVVQSESILDLFKSFTALVLITELDNFAYRIAKLGFLGSSIESQIISAMYDERVGAEATFRKIEYARKNSSERMICCGNGSRRFFFLLVFLGLAGGWGYFVNGQRSGKFFKEKYPLCNVSKGKQLQFGDGVCDGGMLNTYDCHFDGGDCLEFNVAYPLCNVLQPERIADGKCDEGEYNTEYCGYDGGDCCQVANNDPKLGDGLCHGGMYNTRACNYDSGDCVDFNKKYPDCFVESPFLIGDGVCHREEYNTLACGWDGGDCGSPVPTAIIPTMAPSAVPTSQPSLKPSMRPSSSPSQQPSVVPSIEPSVIPSNEPSLIPSDLPSTFPSDAPSVFPSIPCVDEPGWESGGKGFMPLGGTTCSQMGNRTDFCTIFVTDSRYFFAGKAVTEACCLCGGSVNQTIAPSESPSSQPSISSRPTMVPSYQPSVSQHPTVNSNVPSTSPTFITAPPSECIDEPDWRVVLGGVVYPELDCDSIAGVDLQGNEFNKCDEAFTENFPPNDPNGKVAETACCACGGGTHVDPVPFRRREA